MSRYKEPYTLYKRGDYWYYRTYDARGVRTHGISTGQTSKTAARAFCEKLNLTGQLSVNINVTFAEYADGFFAPNSAYCLDRGVPLTIGTLRAYESITKRLLKYLGKTKLCDITQSRVKDIRLKMLDEGFSISAITSTVNLLGVILDQAYNDYLIARNPCDKLPPLVNNTTKRDSLALNELVTVYENVDPEYKNLIALLAITGMRIAEAEGVTPADLVTNENGTFIHLTKQIVRGKGYGPLKTKKERYIPIIDEAVSLIYPEPTCYATVFPHIAPCIRDLPKAEERKLSIHSIRHFFITNAKSFGINPLIVETIAGHSLKGIEGVYTNFQMADLTAIKEWQKKIFISLNIIVDNIQ